MQYKTLYHGSAVVYQKGAVLVLGASGQGKSSLVLHLLALGADLLADDSVHIGIEKAALVAHSLPHAPNPPLIEARGIGILQSPKTMPHQPVPIVVVVDMDKAEHNRLPIKRQWEFHSCSVPLVYGANNPHCAVVVFCLLQSFRLV